MLYIVMSSIEIYLDYAPLWWLLRDPFGCGFMFDISTPSTVILHIEATYLQIAVLIALAVVVIRKSRR